MLELAVTTSLLNVPGVEHPSGPGTTVYRRWAPHDYVTAEILHEPYSNSTLRAPRLVLTGLHLAGEERECLGLLACPDPNETPWVGPSSRRLGHSQIYLWSRITALQCSHATVGDLALLTTHRLAEELAALCKSKSRRGSRDVGELGARWIEHLKVSPDRVAGALDIAMDLIPIGSAKESLEQSMSLLGDLRLRLLSAT